MNAHIAVQRKKPDFMWGGSPKDVVKLRDVVFCGLPGNAADPAAK
jgi:hypothetical protein